MTRSHLMVGLFEDEEDLVAATARAREDGFRIHDAYTPYAVHGLDQAMGLAPSRLTWACFGCGVAGLLVAIALQGWTSAIDWPLNVGGKPPASWPAFVPVSFELTVLFAGLGVVAALLIRARLHPGKRPRLPAPRITDDRFALALSASGDDFDAQAAAGLMRACGAVETLYPVEA